MCVCACMRVWVCVCVFLSVFRSGCLCAPGVISVYKFLGVYFFKVFRGFGRVGCCVLGLWGSFTLRGSGFASSSEV